MALWGNPASSWSRYLRSINQVYNIQLLPHWCGCQKKLKGAADLFYVLFKYNKNLFSPNDPGVTYFHTIKVDTAQRNDERATPIIILWTSETQRASEPVVSNLSGSGASACGNCPLMPLVFALSQSCHICLFVPCWHVRGAGQPGTWHWVTAPVTHHTLSRDAGHWSILWWGSKFRNRNWCELIGFPCWVLRCKYRELWMFVARLDTSASGWISI